MLLRASGQINGDEYDLHALTGGEAAGASGVPHERALLALAEAVVGGGDDAIREARERVIAALGADAFVEAAAVAANFERMVRIADATGIALDREVDMLTASYREDLGVTGYGSAASTPPTSWLKTLVGLLIAPLAPRAMRWMAQRQRRQATSAEARGPGQT